jgi:hypothetical protein
MEGTSSREMSSVVHITTTSGSLHEPAAAGGLGQAPVLVSITTATVDNALVVPVAGAAALLRRNAPDEQPRDLLVDERRVLVRERQPKPAGEHRRHEGPSGQDAPP